MLRFVAVVGSSLCATSCSFFGDILGGGNWDVGTMENDSYCEVELLAAYQVDWKGKKETLFGGEVDAHEQIGGIIYRLHNTADIEANCRVGIELVHEGKVVSDDDDYHGNIKPKSAGGERCGAVSVLNSNTTPTLEMKATIKAKGKANEDNGYSDPDSKFRKEVEPTLLNVSDTKEFYQKMSETEKKECG